MQVTELKPFEQGDLEWLVAVHHEHYVTTEGFDDSFTALVRSVLKDFLDNHDPRFEIGLILWQGKTRLGSIFCVRQSETSAKLRLFFLVKKVRGQGLGAEMLTRALKFAVGCNYCAVVVATHQSHVAASALYAKFGARVLLRRPVVSFGQKLIEEHWKFTLVQSERR